MPIRPAQGLAYPFHQEVIMRTRDDELTGFTCLIGMGLQVGNQ